MKDLFSISVCKLVFLLLIVLSASIKGNATINFDDFFTTDTIVEIADTMSITTGNSESDFFADSIQLSTDYTLQTTKKREREKWVKPTKLDTYVFTDSALKAQRVFKWNADHYFNTLKLSQIDTSLTGNRTELPFYKKDVGVTYLGPTGSATLLHNYFLRQSSGIMPFFDPYLVYMTTPNEVDFYNTKTPYSDLRYATSGSKRISEDNLGVLFTANVLPAFNFGISYNRYGAKGIYNHQATKDKSFTAFASYTGERYVAHAGYIHNAITNFENGGIYSDALFTDTVIDPGAIDVNLKTAQNKLKNNTYFLTHSYGIPIGILNKNRDSTKLNDGGTMVYFGHSLEYSRYNRVYTDEPGDTLSNPNDPLSGYYDHYYLSKKYGSYDSTSASQFNNKLFIRLQPWSSSFWVSNIDAGVGYSFESYYVFNPASYLQKQNNNKLSTGYIYGGASGVFRKYFQWNAFLNYHFSGYRQNDLLFDVTARASIYPLPQGVHLTGRFTFDNKRPAYFSENYYSNHVQWKKEFDKTQDTRIQVSLSIPDWKMEAGFNNALLTNTIFYGNDGIPKQSNDVVNITSVYVQKNFKLGLFHFDHRLLMQLTSNSDVIPLPLLSGNITYYLQSEWVKNVLNTQIGFDIYYNTKFYDYAYNPAVGMFHTQDERKLGNYPWIDVFANFAWKRANIYVKFTNAADGIIGNRDYFSALHYPRNKRMLRIGIRWRFYT